MNSQDMFNGISDIRDYLIEDAKIPPISRRRLVRRCWLGAIAAVLVLIMLWGFFRKPDSVPESFDSAFVPYAIAKAEYPEMAQYPNNDDMDAFHAWKEDIMAQKRDLGDTSSLQSFFMRSVKSILSGDNDKNLIYSPLNVYMLLSVLAQITGGESREQILDLLGSESIEMLQQQVNDVWNSNYRDDGALTCILANSLWLDDDVNSNQETMDILARDFYASSYRGEMGSNQLNEALQDWLNEQTGGLLEEQTKGIELSNDSKLALASTFYFKAKWEVEKQFYEKDNTIQTFHTPIGDIETEFMHREDSELFYWGKNFTAANKPFEMGCSMWFILPDEKYTPARLFSDKEALDFIFTADKDDWENQKYLSVNKAIPKFDVSSQLDLANSLKKLGVKDAFNLRRANFSSMTNTPINLECVKHSNRVIIDEEGCEAASFSVSMLEIGPRQADEKVYFILDRPFIFCITGDNGLPLFVGIVNCPMRE